MFFILFAISLAIIESGGKVLAAFIFSVGILVLIWRYLHLHRASARTWKVRYWRPWDKIKLMVLILSFLTVMSLITDSEWIYKLIYSIILFSLTWYTIVFIIKRIKSIKLFFYHKPNRSPSFAIEEIDKLDGTQFEVTLAEVYDGLGYFTEVTPNNDFGADVITIRGKKKTVIQAKRYGEGRTVGVAAINEVVGASGYYHAHKKIVITNRYFTSAAKETAKRNNVKLIDRDGLVSLLKQYRHALDQSFISRFSNRFGKERNEPEI